MGVLWLISPAAVFAGLAVLGVAAVLLIAWGLAHRETPEWQALDRAYHARQRAAASTQSRRKRSPGALPVTYGAWPPHSPTSPPSRRGS